MEPRMIQDVIMRDIGQKSGEGHAGLEVIRGSVHGRPQGGTRAGTQNGGGGRKQAAEQLNFKFEPFPVHGQKGPLFVIQGKTQALWYAEQLLVGGSDKARNEHLAVVGK
jgi:hypothetical protein